MTSFEKFISFGKEELSPRAYVINLITYIISLVSSSSFDPTLTWEPQLQFENSMNPLLPRNAQYALFSVVSRVL